MQTDKHRHHASARSEPPDGFAYYGAKSAPGVEGFHGVPGGGRSGEQIARFDGREIGIQEWLSPLTP